MTEVPEHLLRRSKERRDATGLSSKGGGPTAPPAPSPEEASPPSGAAGGAAPSAAPAAPPAQRAPSPAAPAVPQPAAPPAPAPGELAPYAPAPTRRRIPAWVYPLLIALPFWAIVYAGAFGERKTGPVDPLVLGQEVYTGKGGCAGCHGAQGQGVGTFPALAKGDAKVTFPNTADHISWVKSGSAPFKGKPYGAPNRPGGQRIAKIGGMPSFSGTLTDEEINAVVAYEREKL